MEAGARPELNAQRYVERWLSLSKPPFRTLTTTGTPVLGRLVLNCCEPGNFGTRLSYERISQLLESAQVRFPGRK